MSRTQIVTFSNAFFDLAGQLHVPEDFDEGSTYPAIVISTPGSSVKEQIGANYGRTLADRGYAVLAFDPGFQGQSGGQPRDLENPAARVDDIRCAVDHLTTLDYVDNSRIGALGICAGGGYAVTAAMTDHRMKAVGTVVPVNVGRAFRQGDTSSKRSAIAMIESVGDSRTAAAAGESVDPGMWIPDTEERHLHAFIREVRLTEGEWERGIEFLTATGHITDDRRQEFILLSDVLGASMQTVTVNNEARGEATEATVFGPFFVEDSPEVPIGGDIAGGATGQPCWVEGTVRTADGRPLAGARIEVWEADDNGMYDVQYDEERTSARAHLFSDADGRYAFWALTPTPYPIPHDGPVGSLLAAVGRSPMRASHLHFMVTAPGMRRLVTHIFVRGDELLDSDSVFGVKDSLIMDFAEQSADAPAPDGRDLDGSAWARVEFDIVLADGE